MIEYDYVPIDGLAEAFLTLDPEAQPEDFFEWFNDQTREDDSEDPRTQLYVWSELCKSALNQLLNGKEDTISPWAVALISGALMHYQTVIRAYATVIHNSGLNYGMQLHLIEKFQAGYSAIGR